LLYHWKWSDTQNYPCKLQGHSCFRFPTDHKSQSSIERKQPLQDYRNILNNHSLTIHWKALEEHFPMETCFSSPIHFMDKYALSEFFAKTSFHKTVMLKSYCLEKSLTKLILRPRLLSISLPGLDTNPCTGLVANLVTSRLTKCQCRLPVTIMTFAEYVIILLALWHLMSNQYFGNRLIGWNSAQNN
jgi:hypothetical protein